MIDVAILQTLACKDDIESLTNGYGLVITDRRRGTGLVGQLPGRRRGQLGFERRRPLPPRQRRLHREEGQGDPRGDGQLTVLRRFHRKPCEGSSRPSERSHLPDVGDGQDEVATVTPGRIVILSRVSGSRNTKSCQFG